MSSGSSEEAGKKPVSHTVAGILLLVLALGGAVMNLPSFLSLGEQSAQLKVIWRFMFVIIILVPWLVKDILANKQRFPDLLTYNIASIFFHSFIYSAYIYLVYYAVRETFVAHTLLLCSIGTTFTAVWKIVKSQPYTRLEYLGVAANIFGAYLCCCEGAPLFRDENLKESSIYIFLYNTYNYN